MPICNNWKKEQKPLLLTRHDKIRPLPILLDVVSPAPLEKLKCDQSNYTNSSEKGLTQHKQMKHCPCVDFRCSGEEHFNLCCDVIALRVKNQIKSWRTRKRVKKLTGNVTWNINWRATKIKLGRHQLTVKLVVRKNCMK